MIHRLHACIVAAIIATTMLTALLGSMDSRGANAQAVAAVAPTVSGVSPSSAPNNLDAAVVITGSGFEAVISGTQVITPPAIRLGARQLADVGFVTSATLTATVPWGLLPGVYTLTVTNPDGGMGALGEAFTVTQAVGVWTTGGPYGGTVFGLAVSPSLTTSLFAAVYQAGLFHSTDAGDTWASVSFTGSRSVAAVGYGFHAPIALYAAGGSGLYRSTDGGTAWQTLYSGGASAYAVNPADEQVVYVSAYDAGLFRTGDGGQTWEDRSATLPDRRIREITIDPASPATLYATGDSGYVYKTVDEGLHWITATTGLSPQPDQVYHLTINPDDPSNLWAMRGRGYSGELARTVDGAAQWEVVSGFPGEAVEDIQFHPQISSTLYAGAAHDVYVSTDSGDSWSQVSTPSQIGLMIMGVTLDPQTGVPLYVTGGPGAFYRSGDGGVTWTQAVEGMAGIEAQAVAAAPTAIEQVYAICDARPYYSANAGQSWALAATDVGGPALAADPADARVAYVGSHWGRFAKTTDGGLSWTGSVISGHDDDHVYALSVHPAAVDTLFAGGKVQGATAVAAGWLARSDDRGDHWADLPVGGPISEVTSIVADPVVSTTLYAGACVQNPYWSHGGGTGVHKSTDGGLTWAPANTGLDQLCVHDLVILQDDHLKLLAAINDPAPGAKGIYRSTDGGATWAASASGLGTSQVLKLTFDPMTPGHVYAATWQGLYRSTDAGMTWSAAPMFAGIPVYSVSATSDGTRTLVYVATIGGVPQDGAGGAAVPATVVEAGVYQLTVLPLRTAAYLPVTLRAGAP